MTKKFCDKCGKEIKKTDVYYELNTERRRSSDSAEPTGNEIICAHLCADCEVELIMFLEKYE